MALGPTTLNHLQGRTLIQPEPQKVKNNQQQQQPIKRGKQRGMSKQHSVHSNAITVRMSCTPKLMQFQALIKFIILSRSNNLFPSSQKQATREYSNSGQQTHEQGGPGTATHGVLSWGLTSWFGTRLLPLLVASSKVTLRSPRLSA